MILASCRLSYALHGPLLLYIIAIVLRPYPLGASATPPCVSIVRSGSSSVHIKLFEVGFGRAAVPYRILLNL